MVYDLDSELPFPTFFWKYATETFRRDEALPPKWHRMFRLVTASDYLKHFASDRRHMKRKDGTWIKTPPDYSPISTPGKFTVNNIAHTPKIHFQNSSEHGCQPFLKFNS